MHHMAQLGTGSMVPLLLQAEVKQANIWASLLSHQQGTVKASLHACDACAAAAPTQ